MLWNNRPVKNVDKTIIVILPLLLWTNGCATQSDLQGEQRARESLRSQIVADNRSSLDEVRREIQKVRGEIEEVRHRLDRASKERVGTGPQLKLLEDRIAVLEKQLKARLEEPPPVRPSEAPVSQVPTEPAGDASGTPPTIGMVPPPSSAGNSGEGALSRESQEVQDEYKIGLRAFQEQQFDRAIPQFRSFQRKYPSSEMADDAQYWIGESYFNQRDYNRAILEFNDVLKYRKGDKVPAALLRQAQAFLEIGDKTDARLILQKLLNDHPGSDQAREAKDRLQALGR